MTDLIKAKIIEAVPDTGWCKSHNCMAMPCILESHRPITLADVLRAIDKIDHGFRNIIVDTNGWIKWVEWNPERHFAGGVQWNLTADYDDQMDELKQFVGKLIGV